MQTSANKQNSPVQEVGQNKMKQHQLIWVTQEVRSRDKY